MAETPVVVDMVDAMGVDSGNIPAGVKRVAIYLTGSGGIAWTSADVERLKRNDSAVQTIIRIDQSNSVLNIPNYLVKDIEPGASSIGVAVEEAKKRAAVGLHGALYSDRHDFPVVRAAVEAAGIQPFIGYWIADPSLDREQAIQLLLSDDSIKAVQWAWPTTNPHTLIPGSKRTLAEANVDLSVTRADWPAPLPKAAKKKLPKPKPPKIHPKVSAAALSGAASVALLAFLNAHGVHATHLSPAETSAIAVAVASIGGYLKKSGVTVTK